MMSRNPHLRAHLLLNVGVLSASMLAYEILMTRIASVLLTSQSLFLILGIALLGIAAGAIADYWLAHRHVGHRWLSPGMLLSICALALVSAIILIDKIGALSGRMVLGLATAIPFAAAGLTFAHIFRHHTQRSRQLYAADLVGAAVGALAVPFMLPTLGPVRAILLLAGVLAVTGAFQIVLRKDRLASLASTLVAAFTLGLLFLDLTYQVIGAIPVGADPNKDLYRLAHLVGERVKIIDSRWSTFGRTDLVRFEDDTASMSIFVDGAAGASMLRFNGDFLDSSASFQAATQEFGGLIPLLNLAQDQRDNALIIGPGGGRDVLLALLAQFKKITAVEINPEMVAMVRDYRKYNGGIYSDFENVDVKVAEGRNYLQRSQQKYDLIMLFMPITKSSRGVNAFAFSENYLFTKEAFADYYQHLTDEGSLLIMAHGMPEIAKMMTTALAALQTDGMGVREAMDRIFILGSEMMPLFGLKKQPLPLQESEFLHSAAHLSMFECGLSYIPGVEQQLITLPVSVATETSVPMMNTIFLDVATGRVTPEQLAAMAGLNLAPATDDSPFFFRYSTELPPVLQVVLLLALFVLFAVLILPANYLRRQDAGKRDVRIIWWLPLYFTAIGMGFIMLENALFQKLIFFLGDPSRSLALLLAALLLGSGAGSLVSKNFQPKVAIISGLASALIMALFAMIVLPLYSVLHQASQPVLYSLAAIALILQGIPMGMMFPAGLIMAEKAYGKAGVPWMWAVNGSASVAGSALAVALAMIFGYTWSLLAAALLYVIAAGSMFKAVHLQPSDLQNA